MEALFHEKPLAIQEKQLQIIQIYININSNDIHFVCPLAKPVEVSCKIIINAFGRRSFQHFFSHDDCNYVVVTA